MKKILLIDSDKNILWNIKTYLSWRYKEVDVMEDSKDAIPALSSGEYSLLICDIYAPPRGGIELVKNIRESYNDRIRTQPIMIVAPEELDADKYLFMEKNKVYFMNKYEDSGTWSEKINSILARV